MAVTRSALTNGTDIAGGATTTTASISVAAGACLVVGLHHRDADGPAASVSWNGNALTRRALRDNAADTRCEIWLLEDAPAGSGTVVITHSATPPACVAYFASEYGNVKASAFDVQKVNSGSSTSPTTGASSTLAQAEEEAVAAIGTNGPQGDSAGSWSNSFTAGVRVGTTGASADVTIAEGYKQLASTAAVTAAKTSITSRAWMAAVITLKEQLTQTSSPAVIDVPAAIDDPTLAYSNAVAPAVIDVPAAIDDPTLAFSNAVAPAAIDVPADVNAPTGSPGAVSSSADTIDVPVVANGATGVAGLQAVTVETVDVLVEADLNVKAGGGITIDQTPRDPEAITSQEFFVLRALSPAALGDGNIETTGGVDASGSLGVGGTVWGKADTMQEFVGTPGAITYLRFRAACWYSEILSAGLGFSNFRMDWEVDGETDEAAITNDAGVLEIIRRDTDGIDPGEGDQADASYYVSTGNVTTQPNGSPWTVEAINSLVNVRVAYDYSAAAPFAGMSCAEIFVEVYGAMGSEPSVIALRQKIGNVRRRQAIRKTLGG